jgi:hypothetical protein
LPADVTFAKVAADEFLLLLLLLLLLFLLLFLLLGSTFHLVGGARRFNQLFNVCECVKCQVGVEVLCCVSGV